METKAFSGNASKYSPIFCSVRPVFMPPGLSVLVIQRCVILQGMRASQAYWKWIISFQLSLAISAVLNCKLCYVELSHRPGLTSLLSLSASSMWEEQLSLSTHTQLVFSKAYRWKCLSSSATYGNTVMQVKCFESCKTFHRCTICLIKAFIISFCFLSSFFFYILQIH